MTVRMWKCFENGRIFRKISTRLEWAQKPTCPRTRMVLSERSSCSRSLATPKPANSAGWKVTAAPLLRAARTSQAPS
jgi:hypothetical protein